MAVKTRWLSPTMMSRLPQTCSENYLPSWRTFSKAMTSPHSSILNRSRRHATACLPRLRNMCLHRKRYSTWQMTKRKKWGRCLTRPISYVRWKKCGTPTTSANRQESWEKKSRHWPNVLWLLPVWWERWTVRMRQIPKLWTVVWQRWWRKPWNIIMLRTFLKMEKK